MQGGDPGRASQLDVLVGVEALPVDEDRTRLGLATQVVLGQRWPLVRSLHLLADQDDTAVEAFGAQRLRRLGAGQAGAHDQKRLSAGRGGGHDVR